jgi:hypothetical protein
LGSKDIGRNRWTVLGVALISMYSRLPDLLKSPASAFAAVDFPLRQ